MSLLNKLKKKSGPAEKKEEREKGKEKMKAVQPAVDESRLKEKESAAGRPTADKKRTQKAIGRSVPQAYRLIREPQITEKATFLAEQNKYVFKVLPRANKPEIKKTIEALYQVKVVKVNLVHLAGKKRRLGLSQGWRGGLKKGYKKAIVTLAPGEKIELLAR